MFRMRGLVLVALYAGSIANALTIPVACGSSQVGSIEMNAQGNGLLGSFQSTVGTLSEAAAFCGEDHFNWYQIVTATNGNYRDRQGNALVPNFIDPPQGGLDPALDPTWADDLPWYWDEYLPLAGTPNVFPNLLLSANVTPVALNYEDFPGGPMDRTVSFRTWLVSLNADSSFHSFHEGFSFDWSRASGVANLQFLSGPPTPAEYDALVIPEPGTLVFLLSGFAILAFTAGARPRLLRTPTQ
jgi:hypothetical protein